MVGCSVALAALGSLVCHKTAAAHLSPHAAAGSAFALMLLII